MLSPISGPAPGVAGSGNEIELFVTRLEERRVLNGDFGLLSGVAEAADIQSDLDLIAEDMLGDHLGLRSLTDPLANESGPGVSASQVSDLQMVLHGRADPGGSDSGRLAEPDPSTFSARQATGEATNMAPTFTSDAFSFGLNENADVGTSVGTVTATDPDDPDLSYSIVGGDPTGIFDIDTNTGEITVVDQAALDYETSPAFSLTVQVGDQDAMMPLHDTASVDISLADLETNLQISGTSDLESAGVLTFEVEATGDDINQPFDVIFQTSDATASDASSIVGSDDYEGTNSGLVRFQGDAATENQSISVTVNDDAVVEFDEDLIVNLVSTTSNDVVISVADAIGTIENDDFTLISVADAVRVEGDSGTTEFTFLINSSLIAAHDISLTANTVDGTATAGSDYTAITDQTVTIAAGTNSATLTVLVNGDTSVEVTETFSVVLSNPLLDGVPDSTRVSVNGSGTGAILDDDLADRATLSIDDVTMTEGDSGTTDFVFTITSDITAQQDIAVTVNTSDLFDAVGGTDYTVLTDEAAVISQGSSSTTVTVSVTAESDVELDETFAVTLTNPLFNGISDPNAVILGDDVGIGTITNDDAALLSIGNASVVEGDSGSTNLVFTLTSDVVGSRDMDVRVNTADLVGADAGTDYVALAAQTAVIAAGTRMTTITVAVVGDTVVESDETLSVNLSSARFGGAADAGRVAIADGTGVGTIGNDDNTTIAINDVSMIEGDGGFTDFVFTLTSSEFTGEDIDVTVNTADLVEATGGTDYDVIAGGAATIEAGTNSGSLIVRVAADLDVELEESFSVTISDATFNGVIDPTRVSITDDQGVGTILDDDVATISIEDVSILEGDAGATNVILTIRSDVQSSRELSVEVDTVEMAGALDGVDYTGISGLTAAIAPGSTSTTVTVLVAGEQLVEFDEAFAVDLSAATFDGAVDPGRVLIGDARGVVTIENDDVAELSIDDVTINEGDVGTTEFVFTIRSNRTASEDVAVLVNTLDLLDADAGTDYVAITNQLVTIAAGSDTTTTTVTVLSDSIVEVNETFSVNLTDGRFGGVVDPTRVSLLDAQGVGRITNDDSTSLTITDVMLAEGNATTTDFVFTISSSIEASEDLEVTVNTADLMEAVGGDDYTAVVNEVITIAAGTTTADVTVSVAGDMTVEIDETFEVRLTDAKFAGQVDSTRVVIADDVGVGTIENDDRTFLTITDVSMAEVDSGGSTAYEFTITSSAFNSKDVQFAVNTSDVDAIAGLDYAEIVGGSATISAGSLSTTVTVNVSGDDIVEFDETFEVLLSEGQFGGLVDTDRVRFADAAGVGTITNDDSASVSIGDLTQSEGDGGPTNFAFTISATAESSQDVTVVVNTADLFEAVAGIDYTGVLNQTATISAGDLATTFIISVEGENVVELDESFEVRIDDARFGGLSDPTRIEITDALAVGTIANDDVASLSIIDVSTLEGDGVTTEFVFTIRSDASASRDIDFDFATADGVEAVAGVEYTPILAQSGTIAAGSTSTTITVQTAGDDVVEIDETFLANIENALFDGGVDNSRVTIADSSAIGTILNDDVASLEIDDVSMLESNTGTTTSYEFTITSSAVASKNLEVSVDTLDLLDAIGGTDYVAVSTTAEIVAGSTSATILVTVNGDEFVELDETFGVVLSEGKFDGRVDTTRVALAKDTGVGTIVNDDSTTISINDVAVVEGNSGTTNLEFTIESLVAAGRDIDVRVDTADLLDAIAGVDYTAIVDQTATITAGSTTTTLNVLVTGDTILEINETFTATLSDVRFNGVTDVGRVTIAKDVGVGTIENDDGLTVSINDVTQLEQDTGTNSFVFTISSTAAASRDIEVTVSTSDLVEAVAGVDYTALLPQTAIISAGTTATNLVVEVTGDDLVELDETFSVNLTNALIDGTAVTIADAQGVGTIVNDDVASLSINDVSAVELDAGVTTYTFTITSDAIASKDIDFTVSTSDLVDATAGLDYAAISSQAVTIDAGMTSATVDVTVVGDLVVESDETFGVNLSNAVFDTLALPGQVEFAKAQGVGTIVNNDSASISIDDVALLEGDAGITSFDFTISMDAVADHDVTVTVNTATFTEALGGVDFGAVVDQTATIAAGETQTMLSIDVFGEDIVELDETFSVNLSAAQFNGTTDALRVTIDDGAGTGTILNEDSATLSIDDVAQLEGSAADTNFVFTIRSSATASRDIDVAVETADLLEAVAGIDYVAVDQDVRIEAGQSSTTVTVVVNRDSIVEIDETFVVNLSDARIDGTSDPTLVSILDDTGQGTIINDDIASLSISSVALDEGDSGSTQFAFTVNSTEIASKDLTFTVNTFDLVEAVAGQDYEALTNQSFTISSGSTSALVVVDVVGDQTVEIDETFEVRLSDALFDGVTETTRAVIGNASAIGTIQNDDSAGLSVNDVTLSEGDDGDVSTLVFEIASTSVASKDIVVDVATSDFLEAIAGTDYVAVNATATISAGASSTTIRVDVLGDDVVELDETFQLNLSNARFDGGTDSTRATILDDIGVGTIDNDDLASIVVDDVVAVEGDTGTTTSYVFTVTSDSMASKDLTLRVDTATLLDAAAGSDFMAIGQDLVILAGTTSATITVDVLGDEIVELDETFELQLSDARFDAITDASRVTISDDAGVGTIINEDSTILAIDDIALLEGTGGDTTSFAFTVTSTALADRDISFVVDTTDLSEALAGVDYTALVDQRVVLSAGNSSAQVVVEVNAESVVEMDETFTATISDTLFDGTADVVSRVSISDDTGLATIINDDSATLSINDVTINEGDSGATDFVFIVTSSASASREIEFTVNTMDGVEATAGTDYASITSQIERIDVGETQAEVTVTIIGDTEVELDELFSITISDALIGGVVDNLLLSISDGMAVGTIVNDDVASFSIADVRTPEGNLPLQDFVFTITTDAIASRDMQVRIDTADLVDAVAGVDYVAITGQDAVITAGSQSTDVIVSVIGDTVLEINETFSVNLSNARFDGVVDGTRVVIGDDQGIGIIENDDGLTVAIDDVAVAEGDAGSTTSFVFTISSTATSSKDIAITVNTSDFVGAQSGIDYTAIVSQTAIIEAGDVSTTVIVDVIGDDLVELDETFSVDLSNAQIDGTIVTIADARGVGTIQNDEIAALSVNNVSQLEGDSGIAALEFTVTSDRMASEAISVQINTASLNEAVAGIDYAESTQTVVIAAGQRTAQFTVNAVGDDLVEIDETFTVELSDARFDGATAASRVVIGDAFGIGTITNDDAVALTIDDVTQTEADAGVTQYRFTITSDGLTSKDLSVNVDVPDRMDPVGAPDLNALVSRSATIAAGSTTTTVIVEVLGDLVVENDETFSVLLSDAAFDGSVDPSRVTFADDTGTGTILNNDSLAIVIDDVSQLENEPGFVFTITSSAVASEDVRVTVDTADLLDAVAPADYEAISDQAVTIVAGTTSTTVRVNVIDDNIVEVDETFTVLLSGPLFGGADDASRVTIDDGVGLGKIQNEDMASLFIDDVTLAEGNAGETEFVFTITSDLISSKDLNLTVRTADLLEATADVDYVAIPAQSAVIAAGANSTTITIAVQGDEIVEIDETFTVELSDALFDGNSDSTRVDIVDRQGLGTILNDDIAEITVDDVSMMEGDAGQTEFTFVVSSNLLASKDLSVTLETQDRLESVSGMDYTAIAAQPVVISAGMQTALVTVQVQGDQIVEVDETFAVNLSDSRFAGNPDASRVVITDARGVGTIINDDTASISINDVSTIEGDAGEVVLTFTISSDRIASKDLALTVETVDLLDAIGDVDYTSIPSQSAVIVAGSNTTSIEVLVQGDEIVEVDETFTVDLSSVVFDGGVDETRAVILDRSGLGTIVNDDSALLSIDDVTLAEGDSGTTDFVFTIRSDLESSKDLSVTVGTNSLLEAIAGTDYTPIISEPAVITAGTTTTTVTVSVIGDEVVEIDETFTVDLSDAMFNGGTDTTRVNIDDASGLGTIVNDDSALLSIDDVRLAEGDSGTTDFVFTISSDLESSKNLSVTVDTNELLEAIAGTDYTEITSQFAVITAGTTTTTVSVSVIGDEIVEIDETFTLDLSAATFDGSADVTRVNIGDGSGLGTILNEDSALLSIDDVTLAEGDSGTTDFVFTISSDLESSKDLGVTVDTNGLLEAIAGTDYTAIIAEPAVITAGATTTTVTVSVTGDEIVEVDETFTLDLSAATFDGGADVTRVNIGDASGLATIINDDSALLSINDVTLAEGDSGTTDFVFTISSDLESSKDLGVTVDTSDLLEAVAGTDYTAIVSEPAVITAGTTTTTVTVSVTGDEIVEMDETFTVDLSDATFNGGTDTTRVNIDDASGLGTIVNDDSALLSIDDVTLVEGDAGTTDFVFTISSDLESSKDLSVTVDSSDLLEAVAGTDYTAITSQPAVITAGTTTTTVTVSVIGDEVVEIDETFTLDLSDAIFDGGMDATRVNIDDASGLGTIVNDDSALLSIDDVTLAEGDAGTTDFVFTISSDLESSKDLGVTVDTNDLLEAIAGTDYTEITSQTAVITAGTTTTTVTVSVTGDEIVEVDETFTLDLSAATFDGGADATRVNIGDASGLGTIINDDSALLSIDDVTLAEGDAGTTDFVFTISSDLESSKDLGVTVDTNDLLEAITGNDYTAIVSEPAVITAGSTTTTVTVSVTGDEVVEIDETFTLDLSAAIFDGGADATRVNIGDSSGLGTIVNEDSALLSINNVTLAEGDSGTTDFVFTINSDLVSSKDLGVTVDTNDLLEALAGTDYTAIASQPAVITAGTTTTTVTVSVVGDEIVEIDETFTLDLSDAIFDGGSDTKRVNIGDASGLGTIVNDDSALLSIDDVTLAEGDSVTTDFVFTISSDLVSSKDLGVTVDTNDLLEALAGMDYTAITSQPAVIAAGTTTTIVTVNVIGDEIVEIDETFTLDLSAAIFDGGADATRVNIDDASGLGTVVNDDSALLSINDVTFAEGDTGTTDFVFTISSDLVSSKDLGVTVDTNDLLEALAGTDYTAITSQPAVIAAGTTTTTVTVNVIGDEIVEIDETFTLDLSAAIFDGGADATRVNIGDSDGLGTIVNDDSALLSIDDVTLAEGDAGTTDFVFTISSDLVSSKDLGVAVDTNDLLEALAGTDYTAITSQPAVIAAGTTTTTVTVNVIGDEIVEIDETFTLDLSAAIFDGGADATRVNIGDSSGLGTIINDDSALLIIDDVTLAEGDSVTTDFVFTITSDLVSSKDLGVTVDTNDLLEALAGTDYTAIASQPAVITAGTTATTVTVSVIGDEIVEIDETFTLDLSDAIFDGGSDTTRVNIGDSSGRGTIVNDDSALLIIDDVTLAEGDSGTTDFVFTISSDLQSSKDLGVTVDTNDLLEAIAGTDYTAITSQPAVIAAGTTTTTVTVSVIGDEIVEIDETFAVDLSNAVFNGGTDTTRVNIDDASGLGTIVNDDSALLSINDVALTEGDSGTTDFVFTINSDLESSKDLGVTVDTNDLLEALAGIDYSAITSQPAVIKAGTTTTTVTVSVIGDEIVEIDETFTVDLSAATFDSGADITRVNIGDASGLGTIINDDSALLSIDDVTVAEGDAGTTDFVFTISSDLQSSKDLGVTVDTNDLLEAIAGTDYTAITSQPALITAGTTTTTVTVSVIGDDIVELDETFTVDLSDAIFNGGTDSTRVNIGDAIGLGTIVNDDSALLSVNDVTLAEGDSGTTDFVFTIRSDLESSKGLGVTVDTNDLLEAIVGTDYTAITSQTAVIDAGTTTTTVTVSVISDEIVEIDETFTVDLSDVIFNGGTDTTRVNIDDASGLGTIVNDDSALLSIDDVTLAEGDSGTTDFVFTISSDLESSKDLGVAVETNDLLEAIAVTDYTAITSQPAVITAGSTTTTVTVSVIGDEIVEIDETFTVDLSDAVFGGGTDTTRVNIDDSSGLGTIVNDDSTLLSINDVTLAEGDSGTTDFVFTITSELESSKDLGVTVDTNDLLEAIAGTDYSAITPQSAVITAGTTTTTVTVSVIGDEVVEIEETFTLDLSAATFDGNDDATRVSIDDASGLGTIINDDMASIMIDDVSMTEGDSGMTSFVFTIRSDLAASRDLGVVVNAADLGNLIGGADLVDVSDASVSIAAGSTSATFTIQVLGDSVVEADEVFLVDIESPTFGSTADASRVTIADNQAMGTIVNDDIATLAINDVAVIEGDVGSTSVTFTVSADNLSSMNTSVTARTIDGFQAIEGIDYLGILEQEVVILAGQSTATLTIDVIGDSIVELDETYQVELSNALFGNTSDASRIRIGDAIGVGTIMNDDSAAITIEDVTAIEGDFGITDFVFTIRQDQLASLDTSVTVNTIDIQQAIEGVDYNAITNQIVTIAAGTQTATLSVGVIGESLVEATEAFRVELSDARFGDSADATRITLGVTTATGTILNDDAGDFLVEDLVVNESDGVAELTVGLANPVDTDVTLEFSLDTNPDIENLNSQILFRAGVSQPQSIRIAITNDVLVEGTESYIGFFELMTRDGENDITATVATSIEIIDDDRATFDVGDVTMDEAAGTISLEVAIDAPFDIDATFDLTAPAQDDLTLVNPTITFGSGSTNSQTVVIALNDDSLVELDEFVDLTLVPQTELGDRDLDLSDRGQVQIIDNDTATFMAEDLRVREGDGTVLLTVSVDNPIDVDTVFSIVLGPNDDILIQTPTITFAGGSDQSQSFSLELIDDTVEELPERIGAVAILETDLGTRSIVAPESVVVNLRDNDTPDFLQDLNEGLLTTSVPILAPTTGTGGNAPGSGPGNGPANNPTGNQPAGDAPADGPSDAVAAEVFAGTEQVTATGTIGQESSLRSTQSSTQSTSGSDGGSEFDDADSTRAKGTSTDSEFESDVGELLFHVVLPNGKLGKKFELDIDLLNEDESSLFDRFRGLPTDVYRVLYREPGSDTFQQLFEIYVVDGKIETLLYSQDAPVEKIDPADDADVPQPGDEPDAVGQDVAQPSADDVSHADSTSEWGRLAVPALAASLVLAKPRGMRSVMSHSVGDPNPSVVKMDHVSRTMRRLAGAIGR